jgi:hypothetical protein
MAFDFTKTLGLVKGGLLNAEETWKNYLEANPTWQQTALVLTGPLLIVSVLLSLIFSRVIGGYSAFGYQSGWFASLIMGLIMGAIAVVIASLVFNFLAGIFKGTPNFSRAFAAVSLAAIPAWIANAVAPVIPYLGFLLAFAGGILSLVYMYRLMPLALNVPQDKRAVHFISALVLIVVVNMVMGAVLGMGGAFRESEYVADDYSDTGVMGGLARQGDLMQSAAADTYDPPADGKLRKDQVKAYIAVMQKARVLQQEFTDKVEELSADMEAKKAAGERFSLSDLGKLYTGAGSMMSASNAEMEVVKSAGGNWAEHQWVKEQLRLAQYQEGEGSGAAGYNHSLYLEFQEALSE